MDGTLSRLTNIFQQSMISPQDSTAARHVEALRLLQERDDGLDINEKVNMVRYISSTPSAANTYLALQDDAIRVGWMRSILAGSDL